MPLRLDFTVAHCTSWDPLHPPSELLLPPSTSPRTIRGYQTPPDAIFPQTIVLKLEQGPAKLEKLQILSHHSKIASEIEVFVGVEVKREKAAGTRYSRWERDEDSSDAEEGEEEDTLIDFTRLGIVILSQNTSHRSRELKTVPIPHPRPQVTHIRFDILGCHSNHLNQHNQAGIVAVSVFGEPVRGILSGESVMVDLDDWENTPIQSESDLEASFMIDSNTLVSSLLAYENNTSLPKNIHSKHHAMNRSNSGHHQSMYSSSPRFVDYHDEFEDDALLGRSPSYHDFENAFRRPRAGLVSSAAVTKESEIRVLQAALACAKDAANEHEDFRLALTLKMLIGHLSRVADDLARLEQAKRVAAQAEEFEMAAKLKREVDSMRAAVDRMLAEEGIRIAEDGVVEVVEPIPKQSLSHQSRRSQSPSSNLLFSPRSRSLVRTSSHEAARHRTSSRDSLPSGSLTSYPVFLMPNRSTPSPSSHGSPRQTSLQHTPPRPSPGGTPSVRTPQRSSSGHITPASSHVGSVVGSPRRRSVSRSASHSTHSTTATAPPFVHENINEEEDREMEEENSLIHVENNLDNQVHAAHVEDHQNLNDQQVEQEIAQEIELDIVPEIAQEIEPEIEVAMTDEPYPVASLSASSIVDHPIPNNNHLSTRSDDSEMGTTSPFSEAVIVSTPEPSSPQSHGSAEFTEIHSSPQIPSITPQPPTPPPQPTDISAVPSSVIVSTTTSHDIFSSQTPEPQEVLLSELAPAAPSSLIVMKGTETPLYVLHFDDRPIPKLQKNSTKSPYDDPESWDALEDSPSTDPLGSRGPEPLSDDQCTEFEQEVYVFGERVVACALSRRFRLREWAFARVTDRIEGLPIIENEGPGTNLALTADEDLQVDGLGLITRKREFLPPHPEVEGVPLVKAALTMTELGLRESRERLVALALTLWESLVSYCAVHRLPPQHYFRHFELVLPVLINKVNDINPRIRAGSVELLIHLCKSFKTPPYTILPHVISKPKRLITNFKQARNRVELARKLVEEMGVVSARQEREMGGLSLESVMDFAAAYLQHQHAEVRDAAVKLGVEVCRIVGVEVVENGLKGIKPGLVENIKKMANDAGPSPQAQLHKIPQSASSKSSANVTPITATKKSAKSKIATSGTNTPDTPSPAASKRGKQKSPPVPLNTAPPAARAKTELQQATPPTPTSANSQPKGEAITLLEMQLAELRAMVVQAGIQAPDTTVDSPTIDEEDVTPKKPAAKVTKKAKTPASAPSKVGVRTRKKTGEEKEEGTGTPPPKGVTARRRSSTDPPAPKGRSSLSNGASSTPTRPPRRASDSSQDLISSHSVRTNPSTGTTPRTRVSTKAVASKSTAAKPPTPRPASPARVEKTCIFCDVHDESFDEDSLVVHYWNDCPILTNCPLCNIILEISTLTEHVVQDCDQRSIIRQCQRCRDIIPVKDWLQHSLRPSCTVTPADIVCCPLCHLVIEPGNEVGWKHHLLDDDGCPHNPRKKGVRQPPKPVKVQQRKVETPTELAPRAPSSASNSSTTRIPKSGNLPVAGIPVSRARRVITN